MRNGYYPLLFGLLLAEYVDIQICIADVLAVICRFAVVRKCVDGTAFAVCCCKSVRLLNMYICV